MDTVRKPAQGVRNILRFNWHYYVSAFILLSVIFIMAIFTEGLIQLILFYSGILFTLSVFISLFASYYIYDNSGLYDLPWVKKEDGEKIILNIHAGFDETSEILKEKFKNSKLEIFDFYDPIKHTEISIERARKAYPSLPETTIISTSKIPMKDRTVDVIYLIFSAHEIRNTNERNNFFKELNRILKEDGKIYITEHLRDFANFSVYNIGFFHFQPKKVWINTFRTSNFIIENTIKHTPFITTFILNKNGNSL